MARVIFIDDANATTSDRTIEDVIAAFEAETLPVETFVAVEALAQLFTEHDVLVDQVRAAQLLRERDLPEERLASLLDAFSDVHADQHLQPDRAAIRIVGDLLPDGVVARNVSLGEWPAVRDELLSSPEDPCATTLVLIDRDFSDEGGRHDDGENQVTQLLSQTDQRCDIFVALVTHQVEIDDEDKTRARIEEERSLGRDRFLVISKLRLNGGCTGFVQRIATILTWTTVRHLSRVVTHHIDNAYRGAEDYLLHDISLDELSRALVYATRGDSVWAAEQIVRMLHATADATLLASLRHDDVAWDLTDRLTDLVGNTLAPLPSFSESALRRMQRAEWYYTGADLASRGVDSGDIFRLLPLGRPATKWSAASSEQYFVLVEQNCNMVIRSNGCREPELPTLAVAEISLLPSGQELDPSALKIDQFALPQFCPTSGHHAIVELNKRHHLPWQAIDPTVWNDDAVATTPLVEGASAPRYLGEAWTKRFDRAVRGGKKLQRRYDSDVGAVEVNARTRQLVLSALLSLGWLVVPVELTDDHLRCGVQRIARLREPHATMLRAASGAYQARQAIDAPLIGHTPRAPIEPRPDSR